MYLNHSGKRKDMYILRQMCGYAVKGGGGYAPFRSIRNGDGMILCSC